MHTSTRSLFLALALTTLAAPTLAQRDFPFRKDTPTVLGAPSILSYSGGAANKTMVLMVSLTGGPTKLQPLVGDARSIDVGIELLPFWVFANSGNGAGKFVIRVPNIKVFAGAEFHLQAMTGPGKRSAIDGISDKIVVKVGTKGSVQKLSKRLAVARALSSPVRIAAPNSPGGEKFLIAGGYTGSIIGGKGEKTSEIFDVNTMTLKAGPSLALERALNTVTLLNDGRVLYAGGTDLKGNPTATCEIYDPKTNKFTTTGAMKTPRAAHAAAVLPDGRVLVAGGMKVAIDVSTVAKTLSTVPKAPTNTAELYDPKTGKWTATASFSNASSTTGMLGPGLVTLSTGKVLLNGGLRVRTLFGIPTKFETTNRCHLYDPKTGKWTASTSMSTSSALHHLGSMMLKDGRYLVTGGIIVNLSIIPPPSTVDFPVSKAAMIYDPKTDKWSRLADMTNSRVGHTPVEAADGSIYVIGGGSGRDPLSTILKVSERLDLKTGKWSKGPDLGNFIAEYGLLKTSYGDIVLVGGGVPGPDQDILVFYPQ